MSALPLSTILLNLHNAAAAAGRPDPVLLAVSKTQPAEAVAALAAQGQRAFGENYVQEAVAKIDALAAQGLEWHLIGHLQSNRPSWPHSASTGCRAWTGPSWWRRWPRTGRRRWPR